MKRKQYSVERIVAALRQAELGMPVADLGPRLVGLIGAEGIELTSFWILSSAMSLYVMAQ